MNQATPARVHFVTGKLAADALRATVAQLPIELNIIPTIEVAPITVAALMTIEWLNGKIQVPRDAQRVILPGYCRGELACLDVPATCQVELGPRDLRALPAYLGAAAPPSDYGICDMEIIAEINHAPQLALAEIIERARRLAADGADVIDLGCDPGSTWQAVGVATRALREQGLRVSIDTFSVAEAAAAAQAGAELVLSVNHSNIEACPDWGVEVVAIPDEPHELASLDRHIQFLTNRAVPFRVDPILEPIGCGLAASLARYLDVRHRYPDVPMLMGIGNVTELTDCDSAGINMVLLAICQELGIGSVLTTEVINWARSSVRECDVARRLVYHAVRHKVVPKHLDDRLVMLRDTKLYRQASAELARLAEQIRDRNYRIFAEDGALHLVSRQLHERDEDPFRLFERVLNQRPETIDPSHAFYLGYELAKAATALALGKQYRQDEALDWGMLTVPEASHRIEWTTRARSGKQPPQPTPTDDHR